MRCEGRGRDLPWRRACVVGRGRGPHTSNSNSHGNSGARSDIRATIVSVRCPPRKGQAHPLLFTTGPGFTQSSLSYLAATPERLPAVPFC